MQCPKCGSPVNPGQKFCTKCGQSLNAVPQQPVATPANVCSACGAPMNPGQKFCTKCGAKAVAAAPQAAPQGAPTSEKGFWDNVTHPMTYLREGSAGVNRAVRRENEARVQRDAERLGLEVVKPQASQQGADSAQPAAGQEANPNPQERRLVVDNTSIEGVNLVSGRAIWDIQKGQIARLVTETEFANAAGLKGVIIQEGCTALVFIDGKMVTMMQAGCYTFPAKTEAERALEQRQRDLDDERKELEKQQRALEDEQRKKDEEYANTFAARGVFGEVAAFGRGVMNFLFGKKKDDTPEQHRKKQERKVEKLRLTPSPKICRVYIVSNRLVNLIFGAQTTAEGVVDFVPMLIPTKLVDVNVAVSMQLQVSNMTTFVTNYLADRKSVSILDFQNELAPSIKATLTQMLRNLDYQASGLPEPIINNIKQRLQAVCNERLQGIEVVRVMDVTDSSADFERFRAVERELFASEKELEFLQRTNEFRNRLEQEQNRRVVDEAVNAEQLRQALQNVNKDKLLSEDEMEQFVMLLGSQKRIREANMKKDEALAMEEVRQALIDMKKSGLVKDDELAALQNELTQNTINRENVTQIMRIQAAQKAALAQQIADFELSDNKMEHDMANALRQAQHQGNLAAVQLDNKRLMDAYNDERNEFDWNRAFTRRQQEDDYNFQNRVQNEDYDWQKQQREQQAGNQQAMFEQQLREQQAQADYGRQRQDKFDDMDILERKARIAQQNMQAMKEAELRELQEQNRSTENLAAMQHNEQMNRDNNFANMSAEQIRAAQLSHLTGDAQVAMAQSYSSEKENELLQKQQAEQKALYEKMMAMQQSQGAQSQEMMMKMAQMMQQGMLGAAGAQMANQQQQYAQQQAFQQQRYEDQVQMKQEYQQQAQYAQQRQDHAQDQAFGAMGGVAGAAASNLGAFNGGFNGSVQQTAAMQQGFQQPVQPQQSQFQPEQKAYDPAPQQPQGNYCPACGALVPYGEMFCGECGQKLKVES